MPNVGRSSTGCATCRKRKVKCDETRPGCRRCAQVRKPCPGYPFQIELNLKFPNGQHDSIPVREETDASPPQHEPSVTSPGLLQPLPVEAYLRASIRAPSPSGFHPLSSIEANEETKIKDEDDKSTVLLVTKPRPESPPKYDISHQSVCFFVHLFCHQAGKLYSFPVIDFIPWILSHSNSDSSAALAATAVSRMTLADQYSGTDVRLQTGHDYSRALTSTMASIKDPEQATSDSTVVAVWLLGLYEAINSVLSHGRTSATTQTTRTPEEEWQSHISHIRGAMHLLRMRGETQFENPRSEKIFRVFKAAIQMRLFMLNSVKSRDFGDLALDVYQDDHEFVPSKTANKASTFFLRIARLTEEIKAFLIFSDRTTPAQEETSKKTRDLVKLGEELDRKMIGWADIEPGWQMMKVRGDPKGTAWGLYPNHALYYFYSFWVYLYWIRYLIARMKLYEALIELVKSDPLVEWERGGWAKQQCEGYKTIIQITAGELIGLTAYALGDVANTGQFNSVAAQGLVKGGEGKKVVQQEMNVVAAMQLVVPLKCLLRSEHVTQTQKGAIDLAINHIGDGYRRRPSGWE